jgi:hypothetical protein
MAHSPCYRAGEAQRHREERLPLAAVRLRKLALVGALLLLATAAPATAQTPVTLLPAVTYDRELTFTPHGPVVLHVLTAPRPGGLYTLRAQLSNRAVVGLEKLTSLEAAVSASETVAGVNGDFFSADGHPTGVVMQAGALVTAPLATRSSIGFDAAGTLHLDRLAYVGNWHGTGQRRKVALNAAAANNTVTLYTPSFGPVTPAAATPDVELVLDSFPAPAPNTDLVATVSRAVTTGGTPIPPHGAVLVGRGTQAPILQAEAPVGQPVTLRLTLTPGWGGVVDALGGGPLLVRNGKPVFDAAEAFTTTQLLPRVARTAVGQLRDGRIVLLVADGGRPGYSVGMTNFELATTLARLGAVTGAALGSGSPTGMAFDGQLLNRPSGAGGEAALADALLLGYEGVYLAPPPEPVLSPNGDGVAESDTVAYKLVRSASVNAQLLGPDGRAYVTDVAQHAPGTATFAFPGAQASPAALPEGTYRWLVSATDDLGRHSSMERDILLDNTLAHIALDSALVRITPSGGQLGIGFSLAHAANVAVTIETPAGNVLRTVSNGQLQPGTQSVRWDGRNDRGKLVRGQRLVARVRATNSIGTVDLVAPFTARRVA